MGCVIPLNETAIAAKSRRARSAWSKVRQKAGVKGRWHDNRHTLVTELSESGAGDEVIMSIAGHVSRAMLSHYSHVRREAKRRAVARNRWCFNCLRSTAPEPASARSPV
jgi:integrase